MKILRILLFLSIAFIALAWISQSQWGKKTAALHLPKTKSNAPVRDETLERLESKIEEAKTFIKNKKYNQSICLMIDMSVSSGKNRFFVYDLKKDTVINAALVTHGRCNENWLEGRRYGNTVGCGCTSLGKYKIGYSYNGRFGLAYKLYGLDKTNDKAFERYVVLHAHDCVPETQVDSEICQSDGCPTVSPGFLQQLKPIIDRSERPVLLWIYE
jgi:hypothetical protein